ncbi:MAG: hypothetical protein IRZ10_03175 [Thermoflavifilum sp.]|nr:hypothetical protein [Thermoflavifilum sp.]MCL6513397.1 hypothetical protein [Alicyclobacillus sp.]
MGWCDRRASARRWPARERVMEMDQAESLRQQMQAMQKSLAPRTVLLWVVNNDAKSAWFGSCLSAAWQRAADSRRARGYAALPPLQVIPVGASGGMERWTADEWMLVCEPRADALIDAFKIVEQCRAPSATGAFCLVMGPVRRLAEARMMAGRWQTEVRRRLARDVPVAGYLWVPPSKRSDEAAWLDRCMDQLVWNYCRMRGLA